MYKMQARLLVLKWCIGEFCKNSFFFYQLSIHFSFVCFLWHHASFFSPLKEITWMCVVSVGRFNLLYSRLGNWPKPISQNFLYPGPKWWVEGQSHSWSQFVDICWSKQEEGFTISMTVPESCKCKLGAAGVHLAPGRRDQPEAGEVKRKVQ